MVISDATSFSQDSFYNKPKGVKYCINIYDKVQYDEFIEMVNSIKNNTVDKKAVLSSCVDELYQDIASKVADSSQFNAKFFWGDEYSTQFLEELREEALDKLSKLVEKNNYSDDDVDTILNLYMVFKCDIVNPSHWYASNDYYYIDTTLKFSECIDSIFAFDKEDIGIATLESDPRDESLVYFVLNNQCSDIFDEEIDKEFYVYKDSFLKGEIVIVIYNTH